MKKGKTPNTDLAALREQCGTFQEWHHPATRWHEIRPGHFGRAYGAHLSKHLWTYIPAVLEPGHKRRDIAEIRQLIDTRSVTQLGDLAENTADPRNQLRYRAHCGDDKALALLARLVHDSVGALYDLARFEPDRVRRIAATYSQWPMLLSLNPQDIKQAKQILEWLTVGSQAFPPTRRGQHVDPRNFWTRLALAAYNACQRAQEYTPILQEHAKTAIKCETHKRSFWKIETRTTWHFLANGDAIIIADWHKRCARLAKPITAANFPNWWNVVKLCVLHHWQNKEGIYALPGSLSYGEALKQVGQADKKESDRRSLALDRVKQALRSLKPAP